jgi:nucleoid-associated protein YgaU
MQKATKNILKNLKQNESAISTFLGALVVLVAGVLLYNYFTSTSPKPEINQESETVAMAGEVELMEESEGTFVPKGLPTTHTVAAGDHLWAISQTYYGNGYNWVDIVEVNQITDPGLIEVGTQLTIPSAPLRYTKDVAMTTAADSLLEATSYTVQKGDHLWSIATRAYADGYQWARIFEANRNLVSNPNVIEVGTELVLPR